MYYGEEAPTCLTCAISRTNNDDVIKSRHCCALDVDMAYGYVYTPMLCTQQLNQREIPWD